MLTLLVAGKATAGEHLNIPPAEYPEIPSSGASIDDFVPPGWAVESRANGDLNGDHTPDIALVVKDQDDRYLIEKYPGGEPLDTNPRMLVVLVAAPGTDGYRLLMENHHLIPRHLEPTFEDPFEPQALEIEHGKLRISLMAFPTMGTWQRWRNTFEFQINSGELYLVIFSKLIIFRNTGEMQDIRLDYLSGRVEKKVGGVSSDKSDLYVCDIRKELLKINDIKEPLIFDPEIPEQCYKKVHNNN